MVEYTNGMHALLARRRGEEERGEEKGKKGRGRGHCRYLWLVEG